jgi:hypothetical protein
LPCPSCNTARIPTESAPSAIASTTTRWLQLAARHHIRCTLLRQRMRAPLSVPVPGNRCSARHTQQQPTTLSGDRCGQPSVLAVGSAVQVAPESTCGTSSVLVGSITQILVATSHLPFCCRKDKAAGQCPASSGSASGIANQHPATHPRGEFKMPQRLAQSLHTWPLSNKAHLLFPCPLSDTEFSCRSAAQIPQDSTRLLPPPPLQLW